MCVHVWVCWQGLKRGQRMHIYRLCLDVQAREGVCAARKREVRRSHAHAGLQIEACSVSGQKKQASLHCSECCLTWLFCLDGLIFVVV